MADRRFREILDALDIDNDALPSPATEEAILHFERHVGHRLPEPLRCIYKIHNGEFTYGSGERSFIRGIFFDYEFLSLEQSTAIFDQWATVRSNLTELGLPPEQFRSEPADAVRDIYSDISWIPFAGVGHSLGIDWNPGLRGTLGQVINFSRDDTTRFQLAGSFDDFLDLVLSRYERQKWHSRFKDQRPPWTSLYDALTAQL